MTEKPEDPSPSTLDGWKTFWLVAALYDALLGASFFFLWRPIFKILKIEPPNNTSYIHLASAFVFVQGIGYWLVSKDMRRSADIVKLGIAYKSIYVAVAVYYLAIRKLISSVFAWFALFDAVFLVFFVRFLQEAQRTESNTAQE